MRCTCPACASVGLSGFGTWALGLIVLGLRVVYRVARGWLRLNAQQPMPQ